MTKTIAGVAGDNLSQVQLYIHLNEDPPPTRHLFLQSSLSYQKLENSMQKFTNFINQSYYTLLNKFGSQDPVDCFDFQSSVASSCAFHMQSGTSHHMF